MALFLGIHDMAEPVPEEAVIKSWESYKAACQDLGCIPKTAHYSADQGKAFCLTEADSAELVQQAHDNASVPVNEVIEVKELQ